MLAENPEAEIGKKCYVFYFWCAIDKNPQNFSRK